MTKPDDSIAKQAFRLIEQCEEYSSNQKPGRDKALRNYNGEATEVPEQEGRSKVVSKDVRSNIRKLMPSIMRTILSNDKVVEYEAVAPHTEDQAEQATDYVNHISVPECEVEKALHDAIFDALTVKTGILKWEAFERRRVVVREFSGKAEEDLIGLDEVGEVSDVEQDAEGLLSFTLKEVQVSTRIEMQAVPRGAFLISPSAASIEDSPLVGERQTITRSELVSRGYDKEIVDSIAAHDDPADADDSERRGEQDYENDADVTKAMETVQVYDVIVRMDLDGDGIAEQHRLVLAETRSDKGAGTTGKVILEQKMVSEENYAAVIAEREAHRFEGHAMADDLIDIQSIKTNLLRQTLDNLNWQNNPQPGVQVDALEDLEAVYKPTFGKPILLKQGYSLKDAVSYTQVPFFAEKSFGMLEYLDQEAQDRTGITDASGGLSPDALQNITATASSLINESGVAQAEMIVRSLARGGIAKAFKGLLGLVVAHADKPRTVKLRGEWVEMDPRQWDTGMDCSVNVGLGAGSRERDLAVLQMILGMQREILTTLGPSNPLVKPEQLYNTLAKIAETAGFPSADPYFTTPDPQEIEAQQQQQANQPSEHEMKAQAQMQIEQAKAQARSQVEEAQMQADLAVKRAEIEAEAIAQRQKLESDREIAVLKGELELTKQYRDQLFQRDKMIVEAQMRPQGAMNGQT